MVRPGDRGDAEFASPDQGLNEGREQQAESEAPTNDVVVDPDTLRPLSRCQKEAARALSMLQHRAQPNYQDLGNPGVQPHSQALGPSGHLRHSKDQGLKPPEDARMPASPLRRPSETWRDEMLCNLSNAVTKDKNADWNNKKGPMPGVKYRGGAPPPPPMWTYSKDDLRSFQKWERKLQVWKVQISAYMPPNEAAMILFVSLRGRSRRRNCIEVARGALFDCATWCHLVPLGATWCHLVPLGATWCHLVPLQVAPSGTLSVGKYLKWYQVAPSGTLSVGKLPLQD